MKILLLILIVTANAAIKCPEKATSPICGIDGNIYANACQLDESAYSKPATWFMCFCSAPVKYGNCSTDKDDTVCGSDGKTYKNRCHLLTASCQNGGTVFETDDRTTTCKVHDCPETALQPVCGYICSGFKDCLGGGKKNSKNLSFYANPCLIGKSSNLEIRPFSNCDCDIHGACPPDKTEVCGNDKKMYKNRCELIHSHCKNPGSNLREVPTKCCNTQDNTSSVDCL